MEGGAGVGSVASLTMDCEDMFKEITKKLYGEEATVGVGVGVGVSGVVGVEFPAAERDLEDELRPEEHITAWGLAALMQKGFPPPGILQANFTPRIDTSAEDRWTAAEEPLAWAHSRIAAYNPAQRLFKCADCECVGFLARVAEHWLGTHSQARAFQCPVGGCGFASGWARGVRHHLARDHHSDPAAADHLLRDNPALDDLTRYLQRLKNKVEAGRNDRRGGGNGSGENTQATEVGPGTGGSATSGVTSEAGKRYACGSCPYATDRRDLFTRHENIHRDEKPFHCYLCQKQFNRADHVKKHFLRMHRDQPYDLNRIRRAPAKPQQTAAAPALHYYSKPPAEPPPAAPAAVASVAAGAAAAAAAVAGGTQLEYRTAAPVKLERAPLTKAESSVAAVPAAHKAVASLAPPAAAPGTAAGVRRKGERRYACCYCAWSGVDNWCLKRHLNTHLKPFACALCEYKAARAERLATHVHKVHNKKACAKCPYLADDQHQLAHHLRDAHHIESRNLKVPTGVGRTTTVGFASAASQQAGGAGASGGAAPGGGAGAGSAPGPGGADAAGAASRRREQRAAGAERLFGYLEASDGSGDEYEPASLGSEFTAAPAPAGPPSAPTHYARDKENAAPLHHAVHHDHCLRY
ncbi:protein charlatan [Galleria mellonella]|uniref:Protein charlatan n=1 Tax=Galleria mellonella TaxID=7137 RepID=A0ABM3MGQ2_GALME|nr:protein charlatan [Galleria mellonella]XP_052750340.1 protein charlatan [Galleria mellonella]XP_052750341.1 protein charlatan [Galleria mellonella]